MPANQMHKAKHGAAHAMTELCESKDALDFLTMAQNLHPIFTPKWYYINFQTVTCSKSRKHF